MNAPNNTQDAKAAFSPAPCSPFITVTGADGANPTEQAAMTISAPKSIPCPPARHWKSASVSFLLGRLARMPIGDMVVVNGASQSYIATTAHRHGFRVATRKFGNDQVGVWRKE